MNLVRLESSTSPYLESWSTIMQTSLKKEYAITFLELKVTDGRGSKFTVFLSGGDDWCCWLTLCHVVSLQHEPSPQMNLNCSNHLLSSFPWSVGLSEHMQMDWQRNWKRITVWAMGIALELSLKEAKSCKMCTIASVIQQIPKMAVTVTTIKVTRFRTLNTPCVRKVMALSRWYYTRRMLSFILLWSVIILL